MPVSNLALLRKHPFHPHRLFRTGHLQTIAGVYWPAKQTPAMRNTLQHHVSLCDGDALAVHEDCDADWRPGDRVVLLVHGLGGSHNSGYMRRLAYKLSTRRLRVFRQDLRGFGAGFNKARGHCHAGKSEDTQAALDYVIRRSPGSPVTLIGFSMGGNIVLKLLGELKDHAPPALDSALAAAPPIDLLSCAQNLRSGFNRIYDWSFVKELHGLLYRRRRAVPGLVDCKVRPLPSRLFEFDDHYTSRVAGFANAKDYYRKSSSAPLLASITRPTLIIAAADDPVIPVEMFVRCELSSAATLHITQYGGHLGYVAADNGDPDRRWLDWRIADWITGLSP